MCGICGVCGDLHFDSELTIRKMNNALFHRGPDEEGYYSGEQVNLAMRRLSILDLQNGSQPIFNESGNVCTVFNGEIYNYPELRRKMESKGYLFNTDTDTEVIVHLYDEYGEDFVKLLRGMFAIAVWDAEKKQLIVARDQIGIKPLYYYFANGLFVFGSEIKAIIPALREKLTINQQALDAYLTFMFIPAPLTIYNEISKLEPGHYLVLRNSDLKNMKYWDFDFPQHKSDPSPTETEEVLVESIKVHLQSDVPMGAFVSGGIDSSYVAAVAAKNLSYPLNTFTVFFKGENNSLEDERPYVRELGERFPLAIKEIECAPNFESIIDNIINAFDEPFGDDSIIPNYYICEFTSKDVKVALSGLGGDELFAGYRRYSGIKLAHSVSKLPKVVLKLISKLAQKMPEPTNGAERVDHVKRFFRYISSDLAETYFGFMSSIDGEKKSKLYSQSLLQSVDFDKTKAFVKDLFNKPTSKDPVDRALYTDLNLYMPDQILVLSDRLSMAHSLEVRVPLADVKVVQHCAEITSKAKLNRLNTKIIIKKIASGILPESILNHKKQGFEPPMAGWLKHELKELLVRTLSEENLAKHGFFNFEEIRQLISDHVDSKQKNNKILFSLLMFQLWFNRSESYLK